MDANRPQRKPLLFNYLDLGNSPWSDDLDALHAMAAALGIRREWFQDRPGFPHYDLPPFRRERALSLGAVEHSLKTWLREQRRSGRDFRVSSLSAPASLTR